MLQKLSPLPPMSFQCGFSLEDELGGLVSAVEQIEQIAADAGIELGDDDDPEEDQDDD